MSYTIASFSGGKDSTAMVLRMIELGEPLSEVVYCDTGMEFDAMGAHISMIRECVEDEGVRFTVLRPEQDFRYLMFSKPVTSKAHGPHLGYGWPSMANRWCTSRLKTGPLKRLADERASEGEVVSCVGYAADEVRRLERSGSAALRAPLIEWGWTEEVAKGYCYGKGCDWRIDGRGLGLYDLFDRCSCWCCPLTNRKGLFTLWKEFPHLFRELVRMEERMRALRPGDPMNAWCFDTHGRWTLQELEERFIRMDAKPVVTLEDFA